MDLAALVAGLEDAGLDPHGLVVVHRGREIARVAWEPYRVDQPAAVYSVSKTLTSLALGFLIADGLVDPAADVATYLDLPNPSGLRVHDLLTMGTGHSAEQLLEMPFDATALLTTAPDLPRGETAEGGLGDLGASGLHASTADLATIGQLLLAGGVWEGRRLIDPGYLATMRTAHIATADPTAPDDPAGKVSDWAFGYGYRVWASREGYRLDGAFGQFVLVVPERDLVISYSGATTTTQDTLDLLFRPVGPNAPDTLALAARGEQRADGSVLARLVVVTSPQRIVLERSAEGTLTAHWHIPPIHQPGLAILQTPRRLTAAS